MDPVKDVSLHLLFFDILIVLSAEINSRDVFLFQTHIDNIVVSANGTVFVATKNFLHQLNQNLSLEVLAQTGPRFDGPCEKPDGCCVKWEKKANMNKILVVDENRKRVLTCGTVRLGACEVRDLHNISHYETDKLWHVAAFHPEASTIAFLVKVKAREYLVTAVTSTGKFSRFFPPTCKDNSSYKENTDGIIFLRNPTGHVNESTFLGFSEAEFGSTAIKLDQEHRAVELQYIHGFQWEKHFYILFNANISGPEFIHMAIKDDGSYIIDTFSQATLLYPMAKKQANRVLSSALINLSHSEAFMVAIFSEQKQTENRPLYFYNLTQFNEYKPGRKAYFDMKMQEANKTLFPIHNKSVFEGPGLLSVSATIVQDWIILFLGTENGKLIKLIMDRKMNVIRPIVLHELENEASIPHKVIFDALDPNYLYLTAEMEVRRIKVASCAQYKTCADCLSAQDPYCGWCTLEKRCSIARECENSNDSVYWITMEEKTNCPEVILIPLAIDSSFKNTKLFTVKTSGKLSKLTNKNTTCVLRNVRNNEVICRANYITECSCPVSNETYTQLENQPEPVIIEISLEFGSLNFTTQSMIHNCYKIAAARLNNTSCSECLNSGCHWCVVEQRCSHNSSCRGSVGKSCPQIDEAKLNSISTMDLDILLKHAKVLKDSNIDLNCAFDGILQAAKWINNSAIQCVRPQFVVERRIIPVNVVYSKNSRIIIDNPNNITVYSCDVQKPGCVFCSPERICKEPVVMSLEPKRVLSSRTATVTIVGSGLNVGFSAMIRIEGMYDYVTANSRNCTIENSTSIRCVLPKTTNGKKRVCLLFDSEKDCMDNRTAVLEYVSNIFITKIHPNVSWVSGGRSITIRGINLDVVEQMQMWLIEDPKEVAKCLFINSTWVCDSPSAQRIGSPGNYTISFQMPGLKKQNFSVTYKEDPEFYNFTTITLDKQLVTIMKKDDLQLDKSEIQVSALMDKSDRCKCNVTEVMKDKIKCVVNTSKASISKLEVKVGKYEKTLISKTPSKSIYIMLLIIPFMLLVFIIIYFWATNRKAKQYSEKLNTQMELLESQFRNQIREGFVELQTEGSDVHLIDDCGSIPFLDYKHFAARTFFPEQGNGECVPNFIRDPIINASPVQNAFTFSLLKSDHPFTPLSSCSEDGDFGDKPNLHSLQQDGKIPLAHRDDNLNEGYNALYDFLSNKQFLVTLIHSLEQQKDFSIKDRCKFASFLTIAFHSKLIYLTSVLDHLLKDLMDGSTAQSKLLLRGTETVVEKLLTNWVSLCMYGFLRESVGEPLFKLVSAIKQRINLGPVDAVSGKALYTINEDWLLWEVTDFKTLKLDVSFQLNTEADDDSDLDSQPNIEVDVLDCDTISQAKEKIFETFFNKFGYSQRFQMEDIDLEFVKDGGNQILQDIDHSSQVLENGIKKLNTIGHYQITPVSSLFAIRRSNRAKTDSGSADKLCHLISPHSTSAEPPVPNQGKQKFKVKEMYLTKLLSSKVALHSFVEDLFRSIWSVPNNKVPVAIRHIFDILQAQANNKKITDPDVLHIWKTNSVPLRFWINILKNPQFVFDIEKTPHLDGCLSVIAQAFMDSFSLTSHQLGKHSPTNKVLYARDIPHYQNKVKAYYRQIADMGTVTKEEMEIFLTEESKKHENEFKERDAIIELGKYIQKYSVQLERKLENEGMYEMNEGILKIKEYFNSKSKCGWE